MLFLKKNKGFTLVEILLVIGVIMIMSIIKVRDINEETQNVQAQILADQIKTVESATNAYLVLKYNDISTLSSTSATCNSGNSTCNITLDTVHFKLYKSDHINNNVNTTCLRKI